MSFLLSAGMQPALAMAAGAQAIVGQDYIVGLQEALGEFSRDHNIPVLVSAVEQGLGQAPRLEGIAERDGREQAGIAVALANVHRQLQAVRGDRGRILEYAALLADEVEQFLCVLRAFYKTDLASERGDEEPTIPTVAAGYFLNTDWQGLVSDFAHIAAALVDGGGSYVPLIHGLGAVGLGLGARMALKVDAACFFSALNGLPVEESLRTYLYGHTNTPERPYLDELNNDHAVPAKMKVEGAWVSHGLEGVGYEGWRPLRQATPVQVVAIDSQNFVFGRTDQEGVVRENDYEFFRDLPKGAILVSPIKSQVSEEHFRAIFADYREAYHRKEGSYPPEFEGGASMEEIYTMLRTITDRDDVRTVHIGGEYFAKNLFLYRDETPRRAELVFASSDIEAAEEAARWFRFPEQVAVSVTDDVSTVLLGGVMKNIVAYALGEEDIETLEKAYRDGEAIWQEPSPGENGYVQDPQELSGARFRWWRAYVGIAEVLGPRSDVAVPREVLTDFCGCTRINRPLVRDKFLAIRRAYDAEDWKLFRAAILDFRDHLPEMANSRNRRGGLIHNLALFIKQKDDPEKGQVGLNRPNEARLLYLDDTIEGYKALRGLHHRLQVRGDYARAALKPIYRRFYTVNGVPKHPELDPLVPEPVRQAVIEGIKFSDETRCIDVDIPADRLEQAFQSPRLSYATYRFLERAIRTIDGYFKNKKLRPGRSPDSVVRELTLLGKALEMISQGLEVHRGEHVARQEIPPYENVIHYAGAHRHGGGAPFDRYYIRMMDNPGHERLEDIAILLSHHQAQAEEAPEVKIEIVVDGELAGVEAVLQTMRQIVSRFRPYQKGTIDVTLSYDGGTLSPSSGPPAKRIKRWRAQRDYNLAQLARLTGEQPDRLARHFRAHTALVRDVVGHDRWSGLIQTGRDKYCGAFRDALRVQGDRAFFGVFTQPDQEYPDEVAVAYIDRNGTIRLIDNRVFTEVNQQAEHRGWDPVDLFAGLEPDRFLDRFRVVAPRLGIDVDESLYLRPLPIRQFPLEEILVGKHRGIMRPRELFRFLLPGHLSPAESQRFLEEIQPLYYAEPDRQGIVAIRELTRLMEEERGGT